jgi:hypothetical protein
MGGAYPAGLARGNLPHWNGPRPRVQGKSGWGRSGRG